MTAEETVPELAKTELSETRAGTHDPAPAKSDPERGSLIGRFAVLDVLGTGGMGVVYAAYDPQLDRRVALKLLRTQVTSSEEAGVRFLREAQAMARIDHPNVLRVHEAGPHGDRIFIAMEFAPGGTLRKWLAAEPRSLHEIIAAFVEAGRGLAAAHAAGLVHRDFKPDNVLLLGDGRACVTDFGLVGVIGDRAAEPAPPVDSAPEITPLSQELTRTGALMGTPTYMAPEQFRGQPVGPAADQFAFCVALYEALYGQRPFGGATFPEICANVLAGEIRPPPRDAQVPARIARAIARGLATDPARRHASMDALLGELGRIARPRRTIAAVAVGVLAAAAVAVLALRPFQSPACGGAGERLATAWDLARRVKLVQAFAATGRPDARSVTDHAVAVIDRWGDEWQDAFVGACRDTRVHEIQSEHVLALRMACLNEALDHARAVLDVLGAGGGDVVDHALLAVRRLPELTACADVAALTSDLTPTASPSTRAAASAIQAELARAQALSNVGHAATALPIARTALDQARAIGHPSSVASALLVIGSIQADMADHAAADTLAEAMYRATVAGAMDVAIRAAARRLHGFAKRPEQFAVGDELGRVASAMAEHARVPPGAMVELDAGIGGLLQQEGHLDAAKASYERAHELATKELGPDDTRTDATLTDLGIIAAAQHHFDDARKIFEQVRAADERLLGSDDPNYATALDNLANIDAETGQSGSSKSLRERALAIRIAALGPANPDVGASYLNLGGVYSEAGDQVTAKTYFEKALAIDVAANGDDSPETVNARIDLGTALHALGDQAAARPLLERALAICEKAYPPDDPRIASTLDMLGLITRDEDRYPEALALFQRARAIMEKAFGPNDPRAADYMGEIAATYTEMGKLTEARAATKRTLSAMAAIYGPDSPRMATALGNYGFLQIKLGDAAGALASFEKARTIFEATLGKSHPMVSYVLLGDGQALVKLQRFGEARGDLERAIAIAEAVGLAPDEVGEMHYYLATALAPDRASRERARRQARTALTDFEAAKDRDNIAMATAWLRTH